ncbi:MAG: hypothetical protein ACOX2S_09905 [bacterium]|jgi:hypothetical protein
MIKLFGKDTLKWSILGIAILLVIAVTALTNAKVDTSDGLNKSTPPDVQDDIVAVESLVEEFGSRLQLVSLLAPENVVAKSIEEHYGDLVSPELLAQWQNDPQNAPGRAVSSPWPDRIDSIKVRRVSDDEYEASGEIIEITSVEKENGGAHAKLPIILVVKKIDGRWLIDAVTLGRYGEVNTFAYENNQYGFRFSLPRSWEDYSIVSDNWEGYTPDGPQGYQVVATGPIVIIRHPEWTEENPRQDIPIMVFTLDQWEKLERGEFHIGAAPIGPSELGRNDRYVFALPARYNFAFPTGFEEVEEIIESGPLKSNVIIDAGPHRDAISLPE